MATTVQTAVSIENKATSRNGKCPFNPYLCVKKGGCAKVICRLAEQSLLVECMNPEIIGNNDLRGKHTSKSAIGEPWCKEWLYSAAVDSLPEETRAKILSEHPKAKPSGFE